MLEPDFNPVPTAVQIWRCGYPAACRGPRCAAHHATMVLRKIDAAGRFVKSSCAIAKPNAVIVRERRRGFEIFDRRGWR